MKNIVFTYIYNNIKRTETIPSMRKVDAVVAFFKGCDLTVDVIKIEDGRVPRKKNSFLLSEIIGYGR